MRSSERYSGRRTNAQLQSNRSEQLGRGNTKAAMKSLLFRFGSAISNASGVTAVADLLSAARGCLFTLHRVAPPERRSEMPNPKFYFDISILDNFLTYLKRSGWDILCMDAAVRRMRDPQNSRRFVNFSIDDVYRDTCELAIPLFRRHCVPVTLYLTTGIPDGTCPLWWAGLESILQERNSIRLPHSKRAAVRSETVREKQVLFRHLHAQWEAGDPISAYDEFCHVNGYEKEELHWRNAVVWPSLAEIRYDPCVEFGAHSVSHPRLSKLPERQARSEIRSSRARIEERLGGQVRHFAFPHGDPSACGPREFALAGEAGFLSAVTTRKGVIRAGSEFDYFSLPRNTLQGDQSGLPALKAHLTGLSALAARAVRV
jgi:peptidoglycan/xylan/chitin deacetylase (PgdA/CDA1 family)